MSRRPLMGRADILLALAGGDAVMADIAGRLGYERPVILPKSQPIQSDESEETTEIITTKVTHGPRPPVPWWRAQEFYPRKVVPLALPPDEDASPTTEVTLESFDPLATVPAFVTRLRQLADLTRPGKRIDLNQVVYELSRGRQLVEFPRLNRRSWGQDLHVVIDLARRLVPYRQDQKLIGQAMKRLLPKGGGTVCVLRDGAETPVIEWPDHQRGQELPLHPGSTWLVLSDLGSLQDSNSTAAEDRWMRIGRRLKWQECAALAMVPCRPDVVPDRLSRLWTLVPWERDSRHGPKPAEASTVEACERILALLSAAVRIEPRLLRAVRKLLVDGRRDPGLESKVWQRCEGTTHCSGAALSQQQTVEFRGALLKDELRQKAWSLIDAAHRSEYRGVALLESLRLGKDIAKLGDAIRLDQARRWFQGLGTGETEYARDFFVKASSQLTPEAWEAAPELHALWKQFCPDEDVPFGYDPALAGVVAPLQVIRVSQVDGRFEYRRRGELPERSSPLATIRLMNPEIVVDSFDDWPDQNPGDAFWLDGTAPEWADRWGRDDFGPWVEFVVGAARQRMRWIPPGEFLMGSAEKPAFELIAETPQQPVTISRGFWLFDTPCTQELWEAVTGEKPSHFQGDQRPVERVSWEDCQKFNLRLSERCPGLILTLPTEAQWEYACRAGTQTATYAGDGALDEIAWYDRNSASQTHPVGKLRPNGFGLHDMLGNVWEWCRDHLGRQYTQERIKDPLHELGESSADRVFRGGSWGSPAQYVRAACRSGLPPGRLGRILGFRCSSSGSEPRLEVRRPGDKETSRRPALLRSQRAVRGRRPKAERAEDSESASEDRLVRVTDRDSEYAPVPRGPIVRLRTDLEDVFLCQTPRPRWATRTGRDQFGLWAEFTVPRQDNGAVCQRLRWIPPGRFPMGSAESEKGRYDDEGPQHEATVAEGFWLFDTPCTQALWEAVMGDNPSQFKGNRRPVERVDWQQASEFAAKLSDLIGLPLRLPSETQWEYACRAGSEAATYAGDFDPNDPATQEELRQIAWYSANAPRETHDVAELRPNRWGLYDMLGNVWEWCQDTWCDRYDQERQDETERTSRVVRGGSCETPARIVRAACRVGTHPGSRGYDLGFRCSSSGGEPSTGDEEPERSGRSRRGAGGDSAAKSDESWFQRFANRLTGKKQDGD